MYAIVLAVMTPLLIAGCSSEEHKIKTVLNPSIAGIKDSSLCVDKVVLTDSMTVIDFTYQLSEEGDYLYIPSDAYIEANGEKYKLIGTKDIPMSDEDVSFDVMRLKDATFSLVFQPIPSSTDSIAFYETSNHDKGFGWSIKNIDLTGKSESIAYRDVKDNQIYVAKVKELNKEADLAEQQYQQQLQAQQQKYYCKWCGEAFNSIKELTRGLCTSGQYRDQFGVWRHEAY